MHISLKNLEQLSALPVEFKLNCSDHIPWNNSVSQSLLDVLSYIWLERMVPEMDMSGCQYGARLAWNILIGSMGRRITIADQEHLMIVESRCRC